MGEASRTYGFGSKSGRGLRKAISNNRNYEYPMNESTKKSVNKIIATAKQLQTENRQFREKNKEYRQALKRAGFLTRDPRKKERYKYGQKKARKSSQFSKR